MCFLQGYEGSLLKVTSKNGKTASPVGFVTFSTRAGAEAAKQDLQVRKLSKDLVRYSAAVIANSKKQWKASVYSL